MSCQNHTEQATYITMLNGGPYVWAKPVENIELSFGKQTRTVNCIHDASRQVSYWSSGINHDGYENVGFKITLDDGIVYSSQMDIYNYAKTGKTNDSLPEQVFNNLSFHAGLRKPSAYSSEQYDGYLNSLERLHPGQKQRALDMLNTVFDKVSQDELNRFLLVNEEVYTGLRRIAKAKCEIAEKNKEKFKGWNDSELSIGDDVVFYTAFGRQTGKLKEAKYVLGDISNPAHPHVIIEVEKDGKADVVELSGSQLMFDGYNLQRKE